VDPVEEILSMHAEKLKSYRTQIEAAHDMFELGLQHGMDLGVGGGVELPKRSFLGDCSTMTTVRKVDQVKKLLKDCELCERRLNAAIIAVKGTANEVSAMDGDV